ncbi:hypothetical protein IAT40_004235 [Kwoniella sp. CBS 6097]
MAPSVPPEPGRRPLAKGSACEACKLRKVRCDAGKPTCRNCLKHGKKCDYPNPKDDYSRRASRGRAAFDQPGIAVNASSVSPPSPINDSSSSSAWIHSVPTQDIPSLRLNPPPSTSQPSIMSSRQGPVFQSFHPSVGISNDEQLPAEWNEMDFSWILDEAQIAEQTADLWTPLDDASRLHCLWVFFTNQSASGLEMNIARFHERLESPNEIDRPHPALLNAIYLITCQASPIQAVRMRERYFLQQVETSLQEAFKEQTGLPASMLDLLRAEILLAEYMWTYAREAEAIIGTGRACRIALAACFDQIPSSSEITPVRASHLRLKRNPLSLPPRDLVDVADRIYAFWSFVLLDICASVASKLPINIDLFTIKTSLPGPWSAYMDPEPQTDRRLTDIFGPDPAPIQSDFGYIIQATFLLHVASLQLLDRSSYDNPDPATPTSGNPVNGSGYYARSKQTISSKDLSNALDKLTQETPDRLRWKGVRSASGDPAPSTAISLHFIICSTRIHIADTNTYRASNDSAMYHVRRMVDSIKLLEPAQIAQLGLAIYILWDLAALVLLREIKRLKRQNDDIAIVALEADLDYLVETLTVLSIGRPLLLAEIQGLAALRNSPPSDVDPDEDQMRNGGTTPEGQASSVSAPSLTTPESRT